MGAERESSEEVSPFVDRGKFFFYLEDQITYGVEDVRPRPKISAISDDYVSV